MSKPIHTTYFFASESNPRKIYQTIWYTDASTSCDCKGWTRRVAPDGSRSCRHTRSVAAGLGEREAINFTVLYKAPRGNDYQAIITPTGYTPTGEACRPQPQPKPKPSVAERVPRMIDLEL